MRNLFRFIKIYHFILLFILIESFSLFLFISNHKFQQSKFLSFTQEYTGAIFSYYSDLNQYLSLKDENDFLQRENAKLYTLLSKEEINTNSILNEYIPARIKQNGSLKWNTYNYMTAMINDIPNHANIQIGDTIQTNGCSSIFPEGINIAKVISYKKGNENGLCNVNIKFLNDMNTVKNVYIINSLIKAEVEEIKAEVEELK